MLGKRRKNQSVDGPCGMRAVYNLIFQMNLVVGMRNWRDETIEWQAGSKNE